MPWEISWCAGTRERLQELAWEKLPKLSRHDIGQIVFQRVEEEIRLHPLPSPNLPQVSGEQLFNFGAIQVAYHIDSLTGHPEIKKVAAS
jgi:hypothetical protein